MFAEWVRCGVGRCGSRFELALELELGRLAAGSSDMLMQGCRKWEMGSGKMVGMWV